jgi:hypothetical protein
MQGVSPLTRNVAAFTSTGARRCEKDGDPVSNPLDRHLARIFTAVLRGWGICPDREK